MVIRGDTATAKQIAQHRRRRARRTPWLLLSFRFPVSHQCSHWQTLARACCQRAWGVSPPAVPANRTGRALRGHSGEGSQPWAPRSSQSDSDPGKDAHQHQHYHLTSVGHGDYAWEGLSPGEREEGRGDRHEPTPPCATQHTRCFPDPALHGNAMPTSQEKTRLGR